MGDSEVRPATLFAHWHAVRRGLKAILASLDGEAWRWRPEGARTSIDWIVRHLATAEAFWILGTVRGEPFTPLRRQDFPDPQAVLAEWDRIHQRSLQTLDELSLDQLLREHRTVGEPSPFAGRELTLHQIFWVVVDHECHHRGQIQLMLRLMGREPNDGYLIW
ncbi:MAG TPA: DinB family protein [Bacillota bacterium]